MKKRRGISDVIATILIIMVTFMALAIITPFVVNFVKNSLEKGGECLDYRDYLKFYTGFEGSNCIDGTANEVKVSIGASTKNSTTGSLDDFNIIFFKEDGTVKSLTLRDDEKLPVAQQSFDVYAIPKGGEVRTYNIKLGTSDYNRAELRARLESGRICDDYDTIRLEPC